MSLKEMKPLINIKVRLFATLRENRGKELIMNADTDVTPRVIIQELKIAEEDVAILLINGIDGKLDTQLK